MKRLGHVWALALFAGVLMVTVFAGCKKDAVLTDPNAKLDFSFDTVMFDTVFSTIGSATKYVMVRNPHDQPIETSIRIGSGSDTYFRMNVDGEPTNAVDLIEIPAEDSIWIFVEVTIDPSGVNNPFIVTDSIVFETNGNTQDVKLVAWGQDAHFYAPNFVQFGFPALHVFEECDMVLTADKPHVFYGWGFVTDGCRLTIEAGAQVYFHKNAGMWIYSGGELRVLGTVDEPVLFEGDRLDPPYENVPGQWDRIWINQGSTNNVIRNATIRNGFIGLQMEQFILEPEAQSSIELTNVLIENMSGLGMLARNFDITARNVGVFNAGNQLLALTYGGNHDFRHCSFGNYWRHSSREQTSVFLSNWTVDTNNTTVGNDLNAYFGNCIFHGALDEELELDEESSAAFDYLFDHCIIKTELATGDANHYNEIIKNPADIQVDGIWQNPIFVDASNGNYYLLDESVAIDVGDPAITDTLQTDLEGNVRDANPDLGAFEHQ